MKNAIMLHKNANMLHKKANKLLKKHAHIGQNTVFFYKKILSNIFRSRVSKIGVVSERTRYMICLIFIYKFAGLFFKSFKCFILSCNKA